MRGCAIPRNCFLLLLTHSLSPLPYIHIQSIGLPGTRKTLLFNGINVTIRLNNVLKSISMYGLFADCSRSVCGEASRSSETSIGSMTYIPTSKVLNEIVAVESAIVHRLNVTSSFDNYQGVPLVLGPDNQAVYTYHDQNPSVSSFYTLGDASSVLQPTKTEFLKPAVGCTNSNCDYYTKPLVYDGTQYWLYSGYTSDVVSSLDYSTKWTLGLNDGRLYYGAAAANNVLWLKDSYSDAKSFSLYDIATRTFLRKFITFEHSQAAKNIDGYNSGGNGQFFFTLSLDGSILYLVEVHYRNNSIYVLGLSTATGKEVHVSMHKLPASMHSELLAQDSNPRIIACGGGMTAAGIAVCLRGTYQSSTPVTHFLPILAV